MTRQFKLIYQIAIILLAIAAAMAAGSIILLTIGADVGKTYLVILLEPLKTTLQISEVLLRAIPLSIIALGISVAYRSGIINIGAEGQMMMGILGTTMVALSLPDLPKPLLIPL
ncbi:MAG: ABC transporter permease, partial [Spirochaetales bacterium]|nr:ABC transporter permease [Spirochaetales bacterium]